MKDTHTTNVASPVGIKVDGSVAYFGWPLVGGGSFGPLSLRFSDGSHRECTVAEQRRFGENLSHHYFLLGVKWAPAYGVPGSRGYKKSSEAIDGGGSNV